MYEIAEHVQRWLAEERPVHVAQVVETRGFSSREPGAALAWTDGESVGALLPVIDADLVAAGGQADGHLVEIAVSDADGIAAGLSCGGVAIVLVQPATAFSADTWDRLAKREPLCLLTSLTGREPGPHRDVRAGDGARRRVAARAPRTCRACSPVA